MRRCSDISSILLLFASGAVTGCHDPDLDNWASRTEIIEAAKRCGINDFRPTPAGAAYAAYVAPDVPEARRKEDCIYDDLKARGRLVTR